MGFKTYQIQILLRLIVIVANCYALTYVIQLHSYWFTLWNLVLFLILQVLLLFRFLTRWQKDVKIFSTAARHGDYNITYHQINKNDPYYELYEMLNGISRYVRKVKAEYVQQHQYFQYVVENAQVGLIAYDDRKDIILINQQALRLLAVDKLQNLEELKRISGQLYNEMQGLKINRGALITDQERQLKLSARLSEFVIDGRNISLLSLMNIKPELEENELQSWQELISVLTHEIMNSITPIHSLNGSMAKYLDRIEGNEDTVSKAKNSLEVINRRSQSLMNFVDRYRKISTVPLPQLQIVKAEEIISTVLILLQEELKDVEIKFIHHDELINVDIVQLEQVLINLITNAVHAMNKSPLKKLNIEVDRKNDLVSIVISDTGKGIPQNLLDKIFIPFFTTREQGSGIGLTLSRQIMQRHNGSIEVKSQPENGTTFILQFPL